MMKLKSIYNPKRVYEGYFETFFIRPFFHQYADFHTAGNVEDALRTVVAWLIVTLGVAGILMGQIGLLGPDIGVTTIIAIGAIWCVLSIAPLAAAIARGAKGGATPRKPKLLGIDTLLGVSCILFFILGLLMMITTLNSGSLNPNAGYREEEDTVVVERDEVVEEPIFTYQDAAPAPVEVDSMQDLEEPDAVDPDESFDPSLAPAEEAIEAETESVNDTVS